MFTEDIIDPLVVGRTVVDNYLLSYAASLKEYFFTIDITRIGIFTCFQLAMNLVHSVHISDMDVHKSSQSDVDKLYNKLWLKKLHKDKLVLAETSDTNYIMSMFEECESIMVLGRVKTNDDYVLVRNIAKKNHLRKIYLSNPYKLRFK